VISQLLAAIEASGAATGGLRSAHPPRSCRGRGGLARLARRPGHRGAGGRAGAVDLWAAIWLDAGAAASSRR